MRVPISPERALQERIRVIDGGCWVWTRAKNRDGYGRWVIDGREWRAHRKAYELYKGPIPPGLEIDHLCRNRACCNPEHMEPVVHATNVHRGESPTAKNRRKTHCKNGHEFTLDNTYSRESGARGCVTCRDASVKRWKTDNPERAKQLARESSERWREKNADEAREKARIAMAKKRSENREAYNAYMREYHRRRRAEKISATRPEQ